ncbi:MAG TPA: BamA/TamA family outer membrane protein [Vicinamibacterales bacterium]|nr:BamA/TamA family outer membrane protein [Vicinamibacterales bacterium]
MLLAISLAVGIAGVQTVDPLEGVIVRAVNVAGLRNLTAEFVERHLSTKPGAPFHRAAVDADRRRLDELRVFSSVAIAPRLDRDAVVVDITVAETFRVLPVVVFRVTDENGLSAGPGVKVIDLFGQGEQLGVATRFGGETALAVTLDSTTITPSTVAWHGGFSDTHRRNTVFDFDEHALTTDVRVSHNLSRGLRFGVAGDLTLLDTGSSGASLSADGTDVIPTVGGFLSLDTLDSSTDPRIGTWAEVQVDHLFGDANSWTLTLDGRRFQRLSARHGLAAFGLATLQSGEVGVSLPTYLQFALGGGNSIRGWDLDSRRGRNQFIASLEYTFVAQPVTPFSVADFNFYAGLQVVGFADLGVAWNSSDDFNTSSAIDGYGVGVRFLVPFVDVIRIDVAWGQPGRGAIGYFGVSLKAARQRQRVR